MSNKDEEERKRHEYLLMEIRLTGEDIKNSIHEKYENRIAALEHFKTYVSAVVATLIFAIGVITHGFRGGK